MTLRFRHAVVAVAALALLAGVPSGTAVAATKLPFQGPRVQLTGGENKGSTLKAVMVRGYTTKPKPQQTQCTFRWYRSGKSAPVLTKKQACTTSSYRVKQADVGKKLTVKVAVQPTGADKASFTAGAVKDVTGKIRDTAGPKIPKRGWIFVVTKGLVKDMTGQFPGTSAITQSEYERMLREAPVKPSRTAAIKAAEKQGAKASKKSTYRYYLTGVRCFYPQGPRTRNQAFTYTWSGKLRTTAYQERAGEWAVLYDPRDPEHGKVTGCEDKDRSGLKFEWSQRVDPGTPGSVYLPANAQQYIFGCEPGTQYRRLNNGYWARPCG
ncbi:MAG: hypothetical protein LBH13_01005 [Cellulomonadaceae bacterium]|jgi:hypothetical protein|nr:hypothetical protein [Cellulomonadaceae bacterium]